MKKRNFSLKKITHCKIIYLSICFLLGMGIFTVKASPEVVDVAQQKVTVTGVVTDENGEALPGVSVVIPKTTIGTVTDIDGKYSLSLPNASGELQFSYVGYKTQTVKTGGKNILNISLKEDVTVLNEMVVIGYGTQKKETVTGAISMVTTKDLLQSPQANISNALVGRLPGLLAVQRSGQPGYDKSTIRIRGVGTFAKLNSDREGLDDDPQNPLIMVDGIESKDFNNIDPSEIASLAILKDASATAVYGVRGANGVILITTRRGETGKPRISFSSNAAVTNFPFKRKGMNSGEYSEMANRALMYDSYITQTYTPRYSAEDIARYKSQSDPIFYPDVDWVDYMLKDNSYQTQTNFNVSGGTERVKYFVSLGYFTQNGMFETKYYDPGWDYQLRFKRYNLRSNFDINISRDLSASFDISTQIGDIRDAPWGVNALMDQLTRTLPMAAPHVIENHLVTIPSGSGSPLGAYNHGWDRSYQNELDGSVRVNYKMDYLLKGFSLRGVVSYKNWNNDIRGYGMQGGLSYTIRPANENSSPEDQAKGYTILQSGEPYNLQYGWSSKRNRTVYMEGGADYARSFGNHNVTGLVLYNQKKYFDPNLQFHVPMGTQGLVGRITYNFDRRYLAEFNLGYNGTENFAKGKRFGTFPAYSLGWVASEEPFFPKNDIVSFIKIRGTYGTVGNDKIGGERFLYRPTTYVGLSDLYSTVGSNAYYWGEQSSPRPRPGVIEGKLGNPVLTWEKAVKQNIGADTKFWKNKIALTFDYFDENRDNILWDMGTIPTIIGAEMPSFNLGKMKNSGWDGEISYNDEIGQVYYFVKANYTYAHNKIVYMDEVPKVPYRQETGQRYGQFFGYVANGLYNTWEEVNDVNRPLHSSFGESGDLRIVQPGDVRYVDINGDGVITADDQVPIGYSNFPEVVYGFSIGGEWKGFDFSVLFQGADKVSNMPNRTFKQGFVQNGGANKDLLKSWTYEKYVNGEPIKYPRFAGDNTGGNYAWSTYWLENARYLRLKNAEIGYSFRGEKLKRIGVGSIRLYVNGSNLITWSNLLPGEDPENPTMYENEAPYPPTRVINVGLNINF
jgi:TonB-linked SusC/RagA family outer membrane protein